MKKAFKLVSLVLCFILLFDLPVSVFAQNENDRNTAYVVLADNSTMHNITQVSMGTNSMITVAEKNSKKGWQLNSASTTGAYLNIDLPDSFSNAKEEGAEYVVDVEYFDSEKSAFCLKYDSVLNPVKEAPLVYLGTSQTWKTATFVLDDAYFANRMEGSDLRICVRSAKIARSNGNVVISKVTIKKYPNKHPVLVKEIKTDEVGNIFGNAEDKKFNVTFKNTSSETKEFDVVYKAIDELNTVAWQKEEKITIESKKEITNEVIAECTRYGLYDFVCELKGEGINHKKSTPFSFINSTEDGSKNNAFGFNVHFTWTGYNPYDGIEILKKANVGYIRNSMPWSDVDAINSPKFTYALLPKHQDVINALSGTGIKLQFIICYGNTKYGADDYKNFPVTEEEMKAFIGYVDFMVKTCQENNVNIHSYEVWNEPSLVNYNKRNEPPEVYAKMVEETAKAIRKIDEDAIITTLSMAETTTEAGYNWAKRALTASNLDVVSGMSLHPYDRNKLPEERTVDTVSKYYDLWKTLSNKTPEMHLTELGYYSETGFAKERINQARYNVRMYVYLRGKKMSDAITLYDLANDGGLKTYSENNYGSVHSSIPNVCEVPYAAKESFVALANMNKLLLNAECIEIVSEDDGEFIFVYEREKDKKKVAAIWDYDGETIQSVKLDTNTVTMYDFYGNATYLTSEDGIFTINATESMCYLEGDFTTCEKVTPKVYPTKTNFEISKGDSSSVEFEGILDTDYTLKASSNSNIEILKTEKNKITFRANGEVGQKNVIKVDVLNGEEIVSSFDIYVTTTERFDAMIYAVPTAKESIDLWKAQIVIENFSPSRPLNGKVRITAWNNVKGYYGSTKFNTIPAQRTGVVEFVFPRIKNLEMCDIEYVVETDDGQTRTFTQPLDFTVAIYTDKVPEIDGVMSEGEWISKANMKADKPSQVYMSAGNTWNGKSDLSASISIMFDDDNFYMFVKTLDDTLYGVDSGESIWKNDSVQFGITFEANTHDAIAGGAATFTEIGISKSPNGPQVYRYSTENNELPDGVVQSAVLAVVREGNYTNYEVKIPWSEITNKDINLDLLEKVGFSMLINDNDGAGRKGWIEYASGIGKAKDTTLFTFLNVIK